MENLFMQVFESRDWVTAQIRQQRDYADLSLARSFHLHGSRPPPWLLPSCAGVPQELNGKPIIPEFLFAGSRITTPATSRTVFLPAAVPNTSFRSVEVPNGYAGPETICDTLDANQHEVPQQKQVSVEQELVEASSEVNLFSVVKRSRSRQRRIEDPSREKDQGTNSGSSDVMEDRIQRSEHATVGSSRTTASLSSKPCGDGANNAGRTTPLLGQENVFHSKGRSTESFKCSKDGDLGNQAVQLDCSQNQMASSDNNVKVKGSSVRNLLEAQVTASVCHALPETYLSVEPKKLQYDGVKSVCMNPASEQTTRQPECALESANFDLPETHSLNKVQVTGSVSHALSETYLSVEPKKLQFDGVESVCRNPASEQTMQQPECALESANFDLAEAQSLNEDPPSTSCSQVPHFIGRLSLDGVEPGCMNADSAPMKQLQESVLECSSLGTHSVKEDQSLTSSTKVPNPTSVLLVEKDTVHTVEDTERIIKLDVFSDRIITQSPKSSEQQCSDSHVSHPPCSESLEPPTQLADTSSEVPASSQISPDVFLDKDGFEDLSHSLINDDGRQSSQIRSAAYPEKIQPQTGTMVDVYNTSLSPYRTQSNGKHSNGCPVVNASVSQENELSQEQHFLAGTSLELNEADVVSPLGHASPGTQNETLDVKPAYDAVSCHSGKLSDDQVKVSALTNACDISVSNKKDESAAPELMSSISARRTSKMHTTERSSMAAAENLHQDGTEHPSLLENAIEEKTNLCTADGDKWTSPQPSIQHFLHTAASHEKINLTESDKNSAACDQKRSVQDGVQVNAGLSSKRRRMRCRSDFDLSRTPCANPLSLNHQVGIAGDMLTTTNFSEKSQPSGHYFSEKSQPFISDAVASCSSDASSRQEINEFPLTPSVEKYSLGKLSSRPGSGSEHMGSIPELGCFRIDEDNSIPEEDEYQDGLPGSVDVNCSLRASGRNALQDITGLCQNNGNSPSLSTRCMDTLNIDLSAKSVSSELKHHSNIRTDHEIIKPKSSHPTSVKPSRNGRHRSEANVDRQSKPSNIVANMTSFIPLVKQKLQPRTSCIEKDVKVKALKAAEAVKRLEEKKQKEQEMRKAAAKVERERQKREKELEQKKKRDEEEKKKRDEEEQKKKREVDVATKKRQREEGEKKETMRKRKCVDEARKQQKQPTDRQRGTKDEKDARQKASDNMESKKNSVVGKNQETAEPALGCMGNKSKGEKGAAVDERPASFGSDAKESVPNSLEESFKMSPFKDSDDEDNDDFEDEQESRRRMKFVPSWARKENLDKILLSNIALYPREIFARKSSFNISGVFSADILHRGPR